MKRRTILLVTRFALFAGLFVICLESKTQNSEFEKNIIQNLSIRVSKWLNNGQIDSVLNLYSRDAIVLPNISGKYAIEEMLQSLIDGGYQTVHFETISITFENSVAVQKYTDVYEFDGLTYKDNGIAKWRLTNGKWRIVTNTEKRCMTSKKSW